MDPTLDVCICKLVGLQLHAIPLQATWKRRTTCCPTSSRRFRSFWRWRCVWSVCIDATETWKGSNNSTKSSSPRCLPLLRPRTTQPSSPSNTPDSFPKPSNPTKRWVEASWGEKLAWLCPWNLVLLLWYGIDLGLDLIILNLFSSSSPF